MLTVSNGNQPDCYVAISLLLNHVFIRVFGR
jgi:hypothetical protein